MQRMGERNKTNKANQEMNHICGRKLFQRNKNTEKEPNLQKLWELTHMKNEHWDKVNEYIAEQIQEIEEDTDLDPIVNAAFVVQMRQVVQDLWITSRMRMNKPT
nr:uncharacterized protein LOC104100808 [Nicotiana tomentosiformis]